MITETIKLAAKGCYYPTDDKQKQCMAWIIERLVLPPDVHGFTDEDMENYIDTAIKKISDKPLPDYDTVKKEEETFFKKKSNSNDIMDMNNPYSPHKQMLEMQNHDILGN